MPPWAYHPVADNGMQHGGSIITFIQALSGRHSARVTPLTFPKCQSLEDFIRTLLPDIKGRLTFSSLKLIDAPLSGFTTDADKKAAEKAVEKTPELKPMAAWLQTEFARLRRLASVMAPPVDFDESSGGAIDWSSCLNADQNAKIDGAAKEEVAELEKEIERIKRERAALPPGAPGTAGSLGRQPEREKEERLRIPRIEREIQRVKLFYALKLYNVQKMDQEVVSGSVEFVDCLKRLIDERHKKTTKKGFPFGK